MLFACGNKVNTSFRYAYGSTPFAFAVSIKLYRLALARAPAWLLVNNLELSAYLKTVLHYYSGQKLSRILRHCCLGISIRRLIRRLLISSCSLDSSPMNFNGVHRADKFYLRRLNREISSRGISAGIDARFLFLTGMRGPSLISDTG